MIRTTLLSVSLVALSACATLGPKSDPVSHGRSHDEIARSGPPGASMTVTPSGA